MFKKSVVTLCLLAVVATVSARQLSTQEARQRALAELRRVKIENGLTTVNSTDRAKRPMSDNSYDENLDNDFYEGDGDFELAYVVETDNEPTVYVYNNAEGGFVIVAANDAVSSFLLGYADKGEINGDVIPPNVMYWLNRYGREVSYATNNTSEEGLDNDECNHNEATVYDLGRRRCKARMMNTLWGQLGIYSQFTPIFEGRSCATGCVATSMTQVMAYHQWPLQAQGQISYTSSKIGQQMTADLSEFSFDWKAMTDSPTFAPQGDYAQSQVARAMLAAGLSVSMNYHPDGSSSNNLSAGRALVANFGYDKNLCYLEHGWITDLEWDQILYDEMQAGRPVLYAGSNNGGGHSFVFDGYDCSGFYHINWGWEGDCNGYFRLTALDPNGIGDGYHVGESIIIGIAPDKGSEVKPVLLFNGDVTLGAMTKARTATATLTIKCQKGIFNKSCANSTVTMGVRLVEAETGEEVYIASSSSKSLLTNQGFTNFVVPVANFPKEGHWIMSPAVRSADGKWHKVFSNLDATSEYCMKNEGNNIVFTVYSDCRETESAQQIEVSDMELMTTKARTIENFWIEADITNKATKAVTKQITPKMLVGSEEIVVAEAKEVKMQAGEMVTVTWDCTLDRQIEAGTYQVKLMDQKGNTIGQILSVEIPGDDTAGIDDLMGDDNTTEISCYEIYTLQGMKVGSYRGDESMPELGRGFYVVRSHYTNGEVRSKTIALR